MKQQITVVVLIFLCCLETSCSKSKGDDPNSLNSIGGTWVNSNWGGVSNNKLIIEIDEQKANATIIGIGSQPFNYSSGEVILTNIKASGTTNTFTANAIFKYGTGNLQTANTTASLFYEPNTFSLLIRYQKAQGIQPPDYLFSRQ